MNFLQIGRISCESVALNIITCFWVGVARKISCTSRRISKFGSEYGTPEAHLRRPTNLVQHFIAFVKNENLDVTHPKLLISYQSIHSAWRCHDNVGMSVLVGQNLDVLLHRSPAVEYRRLGFWHILAKPSVLVFDLIRKLAGVAHYQDRTFAWSWLDLLQGSEDENGSLPEPRFCLAKNIGS